VVHFQVGEAGSECDSAIFDRWDFVHAVEHGHIKMPPEMPFPFMTNGVSFPMSIVGDGGFPAKTWLLKPFPEDEKASDEKKIYNYRLSQ